MHTCGQTASWTIDHVRAEKVSEGLQLEGPAGQAKVSVFHDGRDGVGGSRDRGTEDSGGTGCELRWEFTLETREKMRQDVLGAGRGVCVGEAHTLAGVFSEKLETRSSVGCLGAGGLHSGSPGD